MTMNPRAVADADTFTVRRTIQIAAPLDKVWTAITEPDHISRWFGTTVLIGDGVGAHGTITWPDGDAVPIRIEAIDPPRSVSYRWCNDDTGRAPDTVTDDAPSTVFTFTLEPTPDGTQLTVEETGFETTADPAANLESHRQGWDGELDKLVSTLEGDSR
ncbi:MAG: SRPBCC family protein [Ilumatobacteraceae bacterium]